MSEIELQDQILRNALELQRLSAHEEERAEAILRQLEADLRQLLATGDLSEAGKREVEAIIRQADRAIEGRYLTIADSIDMRDLVEVVSERTVAAMREVIPRALIPTPERMASLSKEILIDGSRASAWWAKQAEDTAFKFAAEVRQGVLNGEAQEQIVGRIVGRGGDPGVLTVARRNARTLVHSSIMSAANQARLETYKKNSRHIDGIRWLASLDGITCIQCMALDGSTWDIEGKPTGETTLPFQLPPAHFSCRCVATPIPKSLNKILGRTGLDERLAATRTRASSSGPTTATTFGEFLKRQSPEFIEESLGTERAALWRAGKITLRDLVSGSGRPLTLDQIAGR